ncbi:MAG: hypothetical protein M0P14_04970 [Alkaliphilus sp.]|nr:hypothetical protein [Alkaliphilus sp.]
MLRKEIKLKTTTGTGKFQVVEVNHDTELLINGNLILVRNDEIRVAKRDNNGVYSFMHNDKNKIMKF